MSDEQTQATGADDKQQPATHEIPDDALDSVSGGLTILPDFPVTRLPIKDPIVTLPVEPINVTLPIQKI